jgi:hypothetical protein
MKTAARLSREGRLLEWQEGIQGGISHTTIPLKLIALLGKRA